MKPLNWLFKIRNINAHCDRCGYDEKITNVKELAENENLDILLNKKCPKCGHTMLNEHDIKMIKRFLGLTDVDETAVNGLPFRWKTKSH